MKLSTRSAHLFCDALRASAAGVAPSRVLHILSAPRRSSRSTTCSRPARQATCSGRAPRPSAASMSAPEDASQPHTARFPAKQAACSGVPPPPSTPVTGTPRSTSHCAVLSWPANAARWSALPPFFARTLASGSSPNALAAAFAASRLPVAPQALRKFCLSCSVASSSAIFFSRASVLFAESSTRRRGRGR